MSTPGRVRARLAVALSMAGLLAAGCSASAPQAYRVSLAEGERAESAGRFADAAASYDAAARTASRGRDREHARYLAALMLERSGDRAAAAARYRELADAKPPGEDAGAAAYKAADMHIAEGDTPGGMRDMNAMLRRFPNDGLARVALHRVLRHMDETQGDAHTLEYLRSLEGTLGKTERGEEVAYETAIRLERLGRVTEARDAFLEVATRWPYPEGLLWDDSLWHASELDEKLGRYPEAIADLERMLAEREASTVVGSYERPRYAAAEMRIAELYRDRLHDRAHAREVLHKLYKDFTTSPLRDHALWTEAELWREDGDGDAACDALSTLVRDFPDSRFVPCATERCPRVQRPAKSKAPATCHPYLERRGEP